jgi:hypothetical protein
MEYNQDTIKTKIQQGKAELELKNIEFVNEEKNIKIEISYSQVIKSILYNGALIDVKLINAINYAVLLSKTNFDKEMFQILDDLGIKI